jgi:hypothetical protein
MYNSSKILLVGVGIFAFLHLHTANAKPAPRNRRFVENEIDEPLEDEDSNELYDRDARRVPSPSDTTYPPFPEEDNWWYQEISSTTTTWRPPTTSESSYGGYYEEEVGTEKPREEFHKKILPWFHRQWGKTKGFFKKHYQTAANSLGSY